MIRIRRILCPVDFSAVSRHGLDHAIAIGRWYESTVTVLHVRTPSTLLDQGDPGALLASVKAFADTAPGAALEFQIAEGYVPAQIFALATALPADLLVLGTSGRSGFERLVLGSVAETVLRKATCPVLTVPARADATAAVFKRILCAIDFSHCSMRALDYAMALAQEVDASLTVLHVIESAPVVPPHARATVLANASTVREYQAAAQEAGLARLRECVPDEVRNYCSVETRLATGNPGGAVLDVAAETKSDLIVIGIHGRSGADLWFFGSTANHVVREATCPVLTLRQP